jgi:hypothetical protein
MMKLSATLPVGETAISMVHISPLRFRRSLYRLSGEGRMVSHSMTCSMRKMSNNGICSLMTEPSLPLRDSFFLSPRTANYIDALIREGDKFDYSKWLQRVREEEARSKQGLGTFISKDVVAAEIGNQTGTSDGIWPKPKLMTRAVSISKALRQVHRAPEGKAPELRILPRLEKIRDAWDEFQASRTRDAVYGFLGAVFEMVMHYKVRRRTKKLLRHAFEFAELPFDRNADPFTAVIRCTSDGHADSKTISKWARALRYVARFKVSPTQLKTFMKEAGGVNACADRYAEYLGRGAR